MKKRIIIVLAIIIIAGIIYTLTPSQPTTGASATLIPANTLFYAESTHNQTLRHALYAQRQQRLHIMLSNHPTWQQEADDFGPAGRFFTAILKAYASSDTPLPISHWVAYSVGVVPVIRLKLTDTAAFKQWLNKADKTGHIKPVTRQYKGLSLRTYAFKKPDTKVHTPAEVPAKGALVIAMSNDVAIITVDIPKLRDTSLPVALGLEKPNTSIADSDFVSTVIEDNGLADDSVFILNHRAILAALTGAPDNTAGAQLDTLNDNHITSDLRQPGCWNDAQTIAKIAPYSVIGLGLKNVNGKTITTRTQGLIRITDTTLNTQLGKLAGHVPQQLLTGNRTPAANLAVALDVSELAPVTQKLQQRFVSADFQCPALVKAQKELAHKNPAAKLALATMLGGLRGVSVSLFGVDAPAQWPQNLDAMLVISAANPQRFYKILQHIPGSPLRQTTLPSAGHSTLAFPKRPKTLPPVKLMQAGNHLVFYTGNQATQTVKTLANDGLVKNGVVHYAINYTKIVPIVLTMIKKHAHPTGQDKQSLHSFVQTLKHASAMELQFNSLVHFVKQGFALDGEASFTLKK